MSPRCVYSAGSHESTKCTTYLNALSQVQPGSSSAEAPVEVNVPAKCVNCDGAHFATDPHCPIEKKYEEARKRTTPRNDTRRRVPAPLPRAENFKYELPGSRSNNVPATLRSASVNHPATSWVQQVSDTAPFGAVNTLTMCRQTQLLLVVTTLPGLYAPALSR